MSTITSMAAMSTMSTMRDRENAENFLFIANLSNKLTEQLLYELFIQAGPIDSCSINWDRSRQRIGLVIFKHHESVEYAQKIFENTELWGEPLVMSPHPPVDERAEAALRGQGYGYHEQMGPRPDMGWMGVPIQFNMNLPPYENQMHRPDGMGVPIQYNMNIPPYENQMHRPDGLGVPIQYNMNIPPYENQMHRPDGMGAPIQYNMNIPPYEDQMHRPDGMGVPIQYNMNVPPHEKMYNVNVNVPPVVSRQDPHPSWRHRRDDLDDGRNGSHRDAYNRPGDFERGDRGDDHRRRDQSHGREESWRDDHRRRDHSHGREESWRDDHRRRDHSHGREESRRDDHRRENYGRHERDRYEPYGRRDGRRDRYDHRR